MNCSKVFPLEESKLILKKVIEGNKEETKQYVFLWIIKNYDKLECDVLYTSHFIQVGGKCHQLYMLRKNLLRVSYRDKNRTKVEIILNLSPKIHIMSHYIKFKVLDKDVWYNHESDYFEVEEEPYLTQNAKLRVMCTLTVSKMNDLFPEVHLPLTEFKNYVELSEKTGDLLISGKFSDLKVVVGEKEFNVHRAILASRCPVFSTMLEANMKEKADNRIVIEDIDSETFYEFLRYIYYGKVQMITEDLVVSLLKLADKYDVEELKSNSATYLAYTLSVDNVLDLYKLAELYREVHLKEAAVEFIADNLLQVMKKPEWSSFRISEAFVDCIFPFIGQRINVTTRVYKDYRPLWYK